jgi:glycosyltransferase involved in cell wall biosynthesis
MCAARFHALLPVRDEADILAQSLRHMLEWADSIYIFDTGSVDETWDVVQDFASKDKRIVPLGKDPVFFSEIRLRGWMFNEARRNMRTGDWFLRVDADEFHHVPPPEFVRTRMRPHETIAFHQYYDFCLTESEVKAWEAGKETIADQNRPIEERRRWFTPSLYSEPRLCRYRDTMQWPRTVSFPYNAGFQAQERLPIRHYPHRDPVQLERRCRLRAIMMADQANRLDWTRPELHHWAQREWRKFIMADNSPTLQFWKPGAELPQFHFANHLAPPTKRAAQRLVHAFCLPVLDRLRPGWPEGAYPQKISENVVRMLEQELRVQPQ